jgi:hypothetical protein
MKITILQFLSCKEKGPHIMRPLAKHQYHRSALKKSALPYFCFFLRSQINLAVIMASSASALA